MRKLATCFVILLALPGTALAAPPANDNRADAEAIPAFPHTLTATTAEATVERLDPQVSRCGRIESTLWYRIDAAPDGLIAFSVKGAAGVAPVVRIYRRAGRRSRRSTARPPVPPAARPPPSRPFAARATSYWSVAARTRRTAPSSSVPSCFCRPPTTTWSVRRRSRGCPGPSAARPWAQPVTRPTPAAAASRARQSGTGSRAAVTGASSSASRPRDSSTRRSWCSSEFAPGAARSTAAPPTAAVRPRSHSRRDVAPRI